MLLKNKNIIGGNMAAFLKIVSGVYLVFVWLTFVMMVKTPIAGAPALSGFESALAFLIAVALSIPAVALFAFGQILGDVRTTRDNSRAQLSHLAAMRRYYEPNSQF